MLAMSILLVIESALSHEKRLAEDNSGSLNTVFSNVVQFQLNILCQTLQRTNSFAVIDDSQISSKYRNCII
jgi:hypothetical protein